MTDVQESILIDWDADPVVTDLDTDRQAFNEYHANRREACQFRMIRMTENPTNGRCSNKTIHCGEVGCPTCGPWLIESVKKALGAYLEEAPLRKVENITPKERQEIMRKYGKDNASVTAVEDADGNVTLEGLIRTSDEIGTVYTLADLEADDLSKWVAPVFGHNKSGNLHKTKKDNTPPAPKVDKEESHLIMAEVWTVDFSECNIIEGLKPIEYAELVDELAVYETQDLLPKTIDELKVALRKRRIARREAIEAIGGKIFTVEARYTRVIESEINWTTNHFRRLSNILYVKNVIKDRENASIKE